jgi:hypothetical protein
MKPALKAMVRHTGVTAAVTTIATTKQIAANATRFPPHFDSSDLDEAVEN